MSTNSVPVVESAIAVEIATPESARLEQTELPDLTECPAEILALDTNAEVLWLRLLRKSGIEMDTARKRVIGNGTRRSWIVRNIGVPDLRFRLECQGKRENGGAQDEIARARIWWRVAESCAPGESIADLTEETMYLLNPFIVSKEKRFKDPRFDKLHKADGMTREAASLIESTQRRCEHCRAVLPKELRANARFCDNSCSQAARRGSIGRKQS